MDDALRCKRCAIVRRSAPFARTGSQSSLLFFNDAKIVLMVNRFGRRPFLTSVQTNGVDTVAPG